MKINKIISLSMYEFSMFLKSNKKIIFLILSVFIYQFIINPFNSAVTQTGVKYSIFEVFIALSNSGAVLMILPLAFLFTISDYPLKNSNSFLYIIRGNRISWIISEILFAVKVTFLFLLVTAFICCVLGAFEGKCSLSWSNFSSTYTMMFPEQKGKFVDSLIPGNLYNQMSLGTCFILSFALLFLYLFTFAMIYLYFEITKKKGIGLLVIAALLLAGTVLTSIDNNAKWIFPTAHSVVWIHYTEYYSEKVMNMGYSLLYYSLISLVIIINTLVEAKDYSFDTK